jgi:alpha-beta hydrolase superfamily lysophospholipase
MSASASVREISQAQAQGSRHCQETFWSEELHAQRETERKRQKATKLSPSFYRSPRGVDVPYTLLRSRAPTGTTPLVLVIHGIHEHHECYLPLAHRLSLLSHVLLVDFDGHGHSTVVPRGYLRDLDALLEDYAVVLQSCVERLNEGQDRGDMSEKRENSTERSKKSTDNSIKNKSPNNSSPNNNNNTTTNTQNRRVFVFGHSFGGLAALRLAGRLGEGRIAGVAVTAPAVCPSVLAAVNWAGIVQRSRLARAFPGLELRARHFVDPLLRHLAWFLLWLLMGPLLWLFGKVKLPPSPTICHSLSHEKGFAAEHFKDSMLVHTGFPIATMRELFRCAWELRANPGAITCPLLLIHGSEDLVTAPRGSALIAEQAGSRDITHVVWEGLFHDLLKEVERDEIIETIANWLEKRIHQEDPPVPKRKKIEKFKIA